MPRAIRVIYDIREVNGYAASQFVIVWLRKPYYILRALGSSSAHLGLPQTVRV